MTLHWIAWFFGGAFLSNAVPHAVSGVLGRPFPSPFATPPGKGPSSPTVNVLWAFANLVVAWLLLTRVGAFDGRDAVDAAVAGAGALAIALLSARHFAPFHDRERT